MEKISMTMEMLPRADWTYSVEPVFLVGCPRSGTTWLQAMLACHPAIYTGPETDFFNAFANSETPFHRKNDRAVDLAAYWTKEAYYTTLVDLFWRLVSHLPAPQVKPTYFLEKTPQHCLRAEFILRTFPHARFIHLIRDGRAVVSSMLRAASGWGRYWAPLTVDAAVFQWKHYVQTSRMIRQYASSSEQYFELKYEDLRNNTGRYLTDLTYWLKLPVDQASVQSAVQRASLDHSQDADALFASIATPDLAAAATEPKPAYPEGFIGPAPYRSRDIQLSRWRRRRVEKTAGSLLIQLGYDDVKPLAWWERVMVSTKLRHLLRIAPL